MIKPTLIVNGTLVNAGSSRREDLVLENGIISLKGNFDPLLFPEHEILDARGKLVFPGGVDPHVHLALPTPSGNSSDDFISGSKAAIAGGTTTFIDFVTPRRGQSLKEAYQMRNAEASVSPANYQLHMGISEWNPRVRAELVHCVEKKQIKSFKAYLAYRESIGISYAALKEVMEIVGQAGGLLMVHCEEGDMIHRLQRAFLMENKTRATFHALSRPSSTEVSAIEKVIACSARASCPAYIVHVSTRGGADAIAAAKKSGVKVFGETCPHYLLLDHSVYNENLENLKVLPFIVSPPLRSPDDQSRLWEGLSDGTFDVVATDHCPFNLYGQKDRGLDDFTKIPNGAGGIEHRLGLLYTYGVLRNKITINQFVNLVSTRPAEIFGMGHHKGKLEQGYDADVLIWDPEYQGNISVSNHVQHCDSEIYEGFQIQGRAETVILGGAIN